MSVSFHDQSLLLGGESLFVRRWQPHTVHGTAIVLLHDSLGSVEQWRDFPAQLAEHTARPVIAYDRWGFGRSAPRNDTLAPDFIAQEGQIWIPRLTHALQLQAYVLFGHSVGGSMALHAAAMASRACVGVVTESSQPYIEAKTREGIMQAKQAFADPAQFARLEKWHGARARWVLDAWTETWLSPAFRDWNLTPWLHQVHCPVLALHGDSDEFGSTAFADHIAEQVSGAARAVILEHCGHVPHRQYPQQVLAHVQAFFAASQVP